MHRITAQMSPRTCLREAVEAQRRRELRLRVGLRMRLRVVPALARSKGGHSVKWLGSSYAGWRPRQDLQRA